MELSRHMTDFIAGNYAFMHRPQKDRRNVWLWRDYLLQVVEDMVPFMVLAEARFVQRLRSVGPSCSDNHFFTRMHLGLRSV
ncbi:Sorbicillinoid biosynthetic cluster transcription factor sor3 [Fusarium oxysporum f. sp. albedinis]|nr:Sorbicillinoid biosynthetic cluster transcription factor sor3 [Fusarium oxysporum f. sp. albedinis]